MDAITSIQEWLIIKAYGKLKVIMNSRAFCDNKQSVILKSSKKKEKKEKERKRDHLKLFFSYIHIDRRYKSTFIFHESIFCSNKILFHMYCLLW